LQNHVLLITPQCDGICLHAPSPASSRQTCCLHDNYIITHIISKQHPNVKTTVLQEVLLFTSPM
jgi:hypothetical protein